MPAETPYNVNDLLLFVAQLYTLIAFLFENNANIVSLCPNSLLYTTLPVAIFVYFYVYNVSKLQTKLIINVINCIVFFSCAIFILSQVCTICNGKIANMYTYFAAICNSCVMTWFGCVNIKKIIEEHGVNTPIATTIASVQYQSVSTVV